MSTHSQRGAGRRIITAVLALVAALTPVISVAHPAAADPPYARPNLKVLSCNVYDDPVNYGDGIDWWKFRFSYTNSGMVDTHSHFDVHVQWVWAAGVGDMVPTDFVQPGLARNVVVTREFWVTATVAQLGLASVMLDSGHDIDEFGLEDDNFCAGPAA